MSNTQRQQEFTNLLGRHQPRVMACIYALLHNMNHTEDVYQDACMVMWRKFDTYQPGTEFVKWACEIAYFETMNFLRRQRTGRFFAADCIEEFMAWESALPSDHRTDCVDELRDCMEQLNDTDRQLLELRYWEPKTVLEIATELHRTPQSICNSLSRIRSRLFDCVTRAVASGGRK